ncbi:MAG: DUF4469 domain-containing protein [Bacteroidales bacterium]|nr:DUF4469 domain-containing protein [Bacteroidales bacterium]
MVTNNPSELIVVIPELRHGSYKLEIVTQFSGNSAQALKGAHRVTFNKILTVE